MSATLSKRISPQALSIPVGKAPGQSRFYRD
jgi:hypothetical protein